MDKKTPKINRNIILSVFLLLAIAFSVVTIVFATAPDPGHNFTESSGGVAQGDLLYGSAADVLSALTKNTTASRYLSNSGASSNPAWAQVDLTNGVTGALPDGNISSAATWNAKMTNPMTTLGDIIYGGASGAATRLAGSAGFLKSTGAAAPAWSAVSLTADVSGILPTANGGTGIAYFTAAGPTVARTYTFPDANATVLTGNTAVTVAQGGTGLTSITANNLIYGNGTGNALLLAPGGTTGAVLMNTAAGAPSWSLLSALPSTAGALPVANGGTSLSTLTANNVILGNGASAPTFVAPGTSGNVLTSDGSTWTSATPTTGMGYALSVQALTSSPTDAATVYFGQLPKAPVTVAATSKVYIRKAGTIKIAQIYVYSGTAGTSEAWSLYIRKNNTTDTLIATVSAATSERVFSNTGLSIAVAAGDYIEIKGVQPTWATNPATTIYGGYIYIE